MCFSSFYSNQCLKLFFSYVVVAFLFVISRRHRPTCFAFCLKYTHRKEYNGIECGKLWKIGSNIIFSTSCHGMAKKAMKKYMERKRRNGETEGGKMIQNDVEWYENVEWVRKRTKADILKYENGIIIQKNVLREEKKGTKFFSFRFFSISIFFPFPSSLTHLFQSHHETEAPEHQQSIQQHGK